jgi:phosphoglycolate phosphatase
MVRLIVFDLDGTLVDSRRDLANAANALIVELGGSPQAEDAIAGMVGEGAGLLVERALAAGGLGAPHPGALERFLALYDERLLEHTVAYEGMIDVLEQLRAHVAMAVLTNKPARATARVLAGLGLSDYFTEVIGGDSALGRKPDPAALLHLTARHGESTSSTLMVGDSAVDLETARRAGTRICLARYGFGYRLTTGDLRPGEVTVDSPIELVSVVERLAERAVAPGIQPPQGNEGHRVG